MWWEKKFDEKKLRLVVICNKKKNLEEKKIMIKNGMKKKVCWKLFDKKNPQIVTKLKTQMATKLMT